MLTLEVLRCTRYQDFLSLCLIRATGAGVEGADLGSSIRRYVADMLRSTDFVGSIGQDVAVLLVHTPESDTSLIADRIRDRIRKMFTSSAEAGGRSATSPGSSRVDLRLGFACFPTDGTSDDALLAHAAAQLLE
jgi:GGDEF domain-containing protein